jgi:hypothetical protein
MSNDHPTNDPEFGLDSRYSSNAELTKDTIALLKARLNRNKLMCESVKSMAVIDVDTYGSEAGSFCPMCYGRPDDKGFVDNISKIHHELDCGYIIAIELLEEN